MENKALPSKKKGGQKLDLQKKGRRSFIPPAESAVKGQLTPSFLDTSGYRIKQIEEAVLTEHLLPFVLKAASEGMLAWAMLCFFHDLGAIQALHEALGDAFILWLLFDWVEKKSIFNIPVMEKPLALTYLETYSHRLSSKERRWIRALSKTYYSLYVVMALLPEHRLKLKDIFLGIEYEVKDCHARFLKIGDILWSRILRFEGQFFCMGMGPYVIPSRYHLALLAYRRCLEKEPYGKPRTVKNLRQYKTASDIYFDILDQLLHLSPAPALDEKKPDTFFEVYFLCQVSMEKIFKKLLPLAESEYAGLEKRRDRQGRLRWVQFMLLVNDPKEASEPVLKGEITLYRKKLKISAHSLRAQPHELRAFIEGPLGLDVTYQKTEVTPLVGGTTLIHDFLLKYRETHLHVADYPSVEAYLESLGQVHWTIWLDEPELALNGLTAREAAQTEEGRQLLEALFLRFENQNKRKPPDLTSPNVDFIKEQLGLSPGVSLQG